MNRCARFPASQGARPCLRVRHPARLPLASELRLRTSTNTVATQCMTETHAGLRLRTPGRALGVAGKWPARFRRASSVTAFELPRDTTNTLSRGADVASSQRLDARGATDYKRRSLSRPQRPRPQTSMRLRPSPSAQRVLHTADALKQGVGSWDFGSWGLTRINEEAPSPS
jgi:hypothetical protein